MSPYRGRRPCHRAQKKSIVSVHEDKTAEISPQRDVADCVGGCAHGWIEVKRKESGKKERSEEIFQIFIKMPGSKSIMLDVWSCETVEETKWKITSKTLEGRSATFRVQGLVFF